MHPLARQCAVAAALLGGICWVANLWLDESVPSWLGLVLLTLAAGVVGTSLARLPWLAVIAGLGSTALAVALVQAARDVGDDRVVDAVVGAAAALLVGLVLLRSERRPRAVGNHRG